MNFWTYPNSTWVYDPPAPNTAWFARWSDGPEQLRVSGDLTLIGTGLSSATVRQPTWVTGDLALNSVDAAQITVSNPLAQEFEGDLEIVGTGGASATVTNPTPQRLSGTLDITGVGSAQADVVDWRVEGEITLSSVGVATASVAPPDDRQAGLLEIVGVGTATGLIVVSPVGVDLAGDLEIAGIGEASATVTEPAPNRLAGRLLIYGADAFRFKRRSLVENVDVPDSWPDFLRPQLHGFSYGLTPNIIGAESETTNPKYRPRSGDASEIFISGQRWPLVLTTSQLRQLYAYYAERGKQGATILVADDPVGLDPTQTEFGTPATVNVRLLGLQGARAIGVGRWTVTAIVEVYRHSARKAS